MTSAVKSFEKTLTQAGFEVLNTFTDKNYGPFKYLADLNPSDKIEHENFVKKFKDGLYAIVTTKSESVRLTQISGEHKELTVQRPLRFLLGIGNASDLKTPFLAYIPKTYLSHLVKAQTEEKDIKSKELNAAIKAQNEFFRNFFNRLNTESQKFLDDYFSNANLKELVINGNRKQNVPSEILEALKTNTIDSIETGLPLGTYVAHTEELELPNGDKKTVTLTVTTKFDGANTKSYIKENRTVTETTERYSVSYYLTSKQ